MTVFNIPIAFATAMASAMIPSVAQACAAGKRDLAREKIAAAIKATAKMLNVIYEQEQMSE